MTVELTQPVVREMIHTLEAVEEQIGWRGIGENDTEIFYCEFCDASHEDATKIPHRDDCLVTKCRAALRKGRGEADG